MKQSYKIPTSLDRSYLDVEVALQTESGMGLRPLPFYILIIWIVAIFGGFLLVNSEMFPFHNLPLVFKGVFMLALLGFAYFGTSRDGGNQMRMGALKQMGEFMFVKQSRILKTRNTDPATQFYRLVKIKDVNEKTGLVTFYDGTCAYVYRVVGNASSLLFDSDKGAIVNRVDNFYRKMPDFIRCEIVTVKEAQKTVTQRYRMRQLYQSLRVNDPDLRKIMQENYEMLENYVGGEFKSIHQYLLLFAGSKEYANKAHTILMNEVHTSPLMFSAVEPLYVDDVAEFFHTVYAAD